MPALPNLLVIGAMKSGTSSLHAYLDLHPEVEMSSPKELNFFAGPDWNWGRGIEWYCSHFDDRPRVRGESSTSYSAAPYVTGAPGRIADTVPDVRLLYLVRDPVERMVSEYIHLASRGLERRSIDDVFDDDRFHGSGYVAKSLYWHQLELYLERFDPAQILVVGYEHLRDERGPTLERVLRFLGVDDRFTSPEWDRVHNTPVRYPLRQALGRVLAPAHVRRLAHLGLDRLDRPRPLDCDRAEPGAEQRRRAADLVREDVEHLRTFAGEAVPAWSL